MKDQKQALILESNRQAESCLYTSTSLYFWLKSIRFWRKFFIIAPIIFGGLAGWSILESTDSFLNNWLTATFALLAGILPAIYKALDLDQSINEISRAASIFKNLQDRFRQASEVKSLGPLGIFEEEFGHLMIRLEEVRALSITPPERFFVKAQEKINKGDYDFDSDKGKKV